MILESELARFGGAAVVPSAISNIIVSLEGLEKSGKNHWAFTAPGPIAFFDLDDRSQGVIHKFAGIKKIVRVPILIPRGEVSEVAFLKQGSTPIPPELHKKLVELRVRMEGAYEVACQNAEVRSIVIDGADVLWELIRMSTFGLLNKVPTLRYQEVSSAWELLLKMARHNGKNLILISRVQEVWSGASGQRQPTGRFERCGYKHLESITDLNLRLKFEDGVFSSTVKSCGIDPFWSGQTLDSVSGQSEFPFTAAVITTKVPDRNNAGSCPEVWINRERWA